MFNLLLQCLQTLFFYPFYIIPFLLSVIFLYKSLSKSTVTGKSLPPSPPKLPIIGNLHQLGPSLHRSFLSLSKGYGTLMLLHLGSKPTLVVSSADAVQEIMRTHDKNFSNRPKSLVTKKVFYDGMDVAFAPYDKGWKERRSICVNQLSSNKKILSFRTVREEEAALMVEKIKRSGPLGVNLSEILITYTYDVICRAAFGWRCDSEAEGSVNTLKFRELLHEAFGLLGAFGWADFIPWLNWMDRVTGFNGRVETLAKKLDDFFGKVIRDREHQYSLITKENTNVESEEKKNPKNFVDIMLEYQRENKDSLPTNSIKAILLDVFGAGTDTTYAAMEWTMSELIRNPRVMKKLKDEIRETVGDKGHKVREADLEKLKYLKAVIKEALRLSPPGPLLLFRESALDVKINGFDIDAGTQVIINAWAIQRDPLVWNDAEEFLPERFLDSANSVDYKGQDFQFTPFGGGRRVCPGMSFAMVNVELVVANLVHEFDWKLPGGADCGKLDMAESTGLSVHRIIPLEVIATPCS